MFAEAQLGCVRRVGVSARRAVQWVVAKFCAMDAGGGRGFDQSRGSGWRVRVRSAQILHGEGRADRIHRWVG